MTLVAALAACAGREPSPERPHDPERAYAATTPITFADTEADVVYDGIAPADQAGIGIAGGADFDGDGDVDIFVGGIGESPEYSGVVVWQNDALDPLARTVVEGDPASMMGAYVASAPGVLVAGSRDAPIYVFVPVGPDTMTLGATIADDGPGEGCDWRVALGASPWPDSELVLAAPWESTSVRVFALPLTGTVDDEAADLIVDVRFYTYGSPEAVSLPGDLDGDGVADLVIGSWGSWQRGYTHVFYAPGRGQVDASDADGELWGQPGDEAGFDVAAEGDLDGDGAPDLAIGAPGWRGGAGWGTGRVLLWPGSFEGSHPAANGFGRLEAHDDMIDLAFEVALGGDADGDGHDDLLVSALDGYELGAAYLVHGPITGAHVIEDVAALRLDGSDNREIINVAFAGDVDGDGTDEFLLGAPAVPAVVGQAYLYFGPR